MPLMGEVDNFCLKTNTSCGNLYVRVHHIQGKTAIYNINNSIVKSIYYDCYFQ